MTTEPLSFRDQVAITLFPQILAPLMDEGRRRRDNPDATALLAAQTTWKLVGWLESERPADPSLRASSTVIYPATEGKETQP